MNRICDMFGCVGPANKLYSLAPGTNLWLCTGCAETEGLEFATTVPELHILLDTETAARKFPCRHHWVIGPANGAVSVGVCKYCQETRKFKNFIDTSKRDPAPNLHSAPVTNNQSDESSGG